jgi:hypothetical protein
MSVIQAPAVQSQAAYKNKRILPVFQDFNTATSWTVNLQQLGFEPTEVRLLQYGANNEVKTQAAGVISCSELKDFFVIICCPPQSSVSSQAKLIVPTSGPLSSLTFTFSTDGKSQPQITQDLQVFMVLEFLRR